jgi:hypothetical protein
MKTLNKRIALLLASHLIILAASVIIWKDLGGLSSSIYQREKNQFKPYQNSQNCPEEYENYTYCLNLKGEKNNTLLIGDSSILALAPNMTGGVLALGAGSCPLLIGLVVDYSALECKGLTAELTDKIVDGKLKGQSWVLAHRSEYINKVGVEIYLKAVNNIVEIIRIHNKDAKIKFVIEPPRLNRLITECKKRKYINKNKTCDFEGMDLIIERSKLLNDYFVGELIYTPDFNKLLNHIDAYYKDTSHITVEAAAAVYHSDLF